MYTPANHYFAAPHLMRLLLADCPTVQSVLGVADDDEPAVSALAKVHTYGEEVTEANVPILAYPTALVREMEVHLRTGDGGEFLSVDQRTIECWFAFYVPDLETIETISDEKAWVDEQFAAIVRECLTRSGKGTSITGSTQLQVFNPVYEGCEREPDSDRGDSRLDSQPDRPRWFGLLMWEVH